MIDLLSRSDTIEPDTAQLMGNAALCTTLRFVSLNASDLEHAVTIYYIHQQP